jgi:hypothetical protein
MPVLSTKTRCTDAENNLTCCGEDTEEYWKVVSFSFAPINPQATCVTNTVLTVSNDCIFGTPFEVLVAAVSGTITVTCPAGQPATVCGALSVYSAPSVFSNPARISFGGFTFLGKTAQAIMEFEDCATPIPDKDVIFTFNLEKCSP